MAMRMNADDVYIWANWLLLASLIVGVISTYGIVASGKLRDEQSKRDLAEARTVAAQAHERAAILEKEAASARLETERLKALAAWRRISSDQHAKLVESLRGKVKGKVWVEFVDTDPEATQFHADLWQTLKDANVNVQWFSGWERAVGLQITNSQSEDAQILQRAFNAVGIAFESKNEPGLKSAAADVEIIIGSKPPAFYTNQVGASHAR